MEWPLLKAERFGSRRLFDDNSVVCFKTAGGGGGFPLESIVRNDGARTITSLRSSGRYATLMVQGLAGLMCPHEPPHQVLVSLQPLEPLTLGGGVRWRPLVVFLMVASQTQPG